MPTTTPDPDQPAKRKILIVDDHPVLRRGLAALIGSEPGLVVCGEAATCRAALDAIRANQPDLVIVDLVLEGCDGLDLVKDMKTRHPQIPALVLSMHDEAVYAERSLRAGARGYVTKQELDDTLLIAIHRLLDGEMYMSHKLEARLAAKFVTGRTLDTSSALDALSDRELQVFRLIGQGRSTRQIAETLHLSIKTIESHRQHIKAHFPPPKLAKPLATTELDGNFGFHTHGYSAACHCDMSLIIWIICHDLRAWLIVSLRSRLLQQLSCICMATS